MNKGKRTSTDYSRTTCCLVLLIQKVLLGLKREQPGKVSSHIIEGCKCHVKEFGVDLIGNTKLLKALN